MAEPAAATITVAACAASGAILYPVLCDMGLHPVSLGAGLFGCVVVQLLMPPERVSLRMVAATTLGSMLFATLASPFALPLIAKWQMIPGGVTPSQAHVAVASVLGAFAKPLVAVFAKQFNKWASRLAAKGARDA